MISPGGCQGFSMLDLLYNLCLTYRVEKKFWYLG